jgi:phospholipase D1/2
MQEGLMGVHDEDTKKYFKNSAVCCVLAPRYADSKLSWFRQKVHISPLGTQLGYRIIHPHSFGIRR